MGIGPPAVELYRTLRDSGHLKGLKKVIELGSQDIPLHDWHQNWAKDFIASVGGPRNDAPLTAEQFHKGLGFTDYACIDADGNNGAHVFDLNLDLRDAYGFTEKFDLVTNHGTSEHVFNQFQCFKNVHELLRVGGVALHVLPFEGYLNHGYFNYQPSMFVDMAIANQYELLGMWYHSQRGSKWFKYRGNTVPLHYTDDLMSVLDTLSREGKLMSSPLNTDSALSVVYRKTAEDAFRLPFDSRFSDKNKLGESYVVSSISERNKMYTPADHLRDVNAHLGQGRPVALIRKALGNPGAFLRRLLKIVFGKS